MVLEAPTPALQAGHLRDDRMRMRFVQNRGSRSQRSLQFLGGMLGGVHGAQATHISITEGHLQVDTRQMQGLERAISSTCVIFGWLCCSMRLANLVWDERATLGRVRHFMQTHRAVHSRRAQGRQHCTQAICESTECECVLRKTAEAGATDLCNFCCFWLAPLLHVDAHEFHLEPARRGMHMRGVEKGGSRSQRSLQLLLLLAG